MKENKFNPNTPNFRKEAAEKIANLFPEVISDGEIDFDALKEALSPDLEQDGGNEKYEFTWRGKRDAKRIADTPVRNTTLIADQEKSKDWDTTQNVYIEGDNLEVLKLMQKAYAEKVKLIYLDPPYNTGKDFVYHDDFHDSYENYLKQTGQVDEDGNFTTTNKETNGRFHTDWLNMMYPRLKLARNLLTDDGVLLISINKSEFDNLVKIVKEIFGENNYIDSFIWQNKKGGGNDSKFIAVEHEYILFIAKNINSLDPVFESYSDQYKKRYKNKDEKGYYFWDTFKRSSGKQYYPITMPDGTVIENDEFGNPISWLRSEDTFKQNLLDGEIRFVKGTDGWSVHFKQRMPKGKKPRSLLLSKGTTSTGSDNIIDLFQKNIFSNPKPVELIKYFVETFSSPNDIVADFFSGSGTTAEAVMKTKNRHWLLVSLPENIDDQLNSTNNKQIINNAISVLDSLGQNHLLTNLAEERIRRVGEKIISDDEQSVKNLDIGFKVFELQASTLKHWNEDPNEFENQLALFEKDPFTENSTLDQRAQEIALKEGIPLSVNATKQDDIYHFVSDDKEVFVVLGKYDENLLKNINPQRKLMTATVVLSEQNNGSETKFNLLEELKQDAELNNHFNLEWL